MNLRLCYTGSIHTGDKIDCRQCARGLKFMGRIQKYEQVDWTMDIIVNAYTAL